MLRSGCQVSRLILTDHKATFNNFLHQTLQIFGFKSRLRNKTSSILTTSIPLTFYCSKQEVLDQMSRDGLQTANSVSEIFRLLIDSLAYLQSISSFRPCCTSAEIWWSSRRSLLSWSYYTRHLSSKLLEHQSAHWLGIQKVSCAPSWIRANRWVNEQNDAAYRRSRRVQIRYALYESFLQ